MASKIKEFIAGLSVSATAKAGEYSTGVTRGAAVSGAYFGFTVQEFAFLVSIVLGILSFILSWYFKRKTYLLLEAKYSEEAIVEEISK